MTEEFTISVTYNDTEQQFPGKLLLQGYTHKIQVSVHGNEVYFKPDEENQYRAVKMPRQDEKALQKLAKRLLSAIGKQIEAILA